MPGRAWNFCQMFWRFLGHHEKMRVYPRDNCGRKRTDLEVFGILLWERTLEKRDEIRVVDVLVS